MDFTIHTALEKHGTQLLYIALGMDHLVILLVDHIGVVLRALVTFHIKQLL